MMRILVMSILSSVYVGTNMRATSHAREMTNSDTLAVMSPTLADFAPQIVALLVGGLIGSLGVTYLARRGRSQAKLARMSAWAFALMCFVLLAGGGGGAVLLIRRALAANSLSLESITTAQLLLFGLLVGMPLSLPGVVFAWSDARARERRRLKRKDFVPTKDDRRRFASDLARQIEEVSPHRRAVTVSIGGEGGRVLLIEGEIDAQEGERLTVALKTELAEHGFKRVEGKYGTKEWWSRI